MGVSVLIRMLKGAERETVSFGCKNSNAALCFITGVSAYPIVSASSRKGPSSSSYRIFLVKKTVEFPVFGAGVVLSVETRPVGSCAQRSA